MFSRSQSVTVFRPGGHSAITSFFKIFNPISLMQRVSVWIKIFLSIGASLCVYATNLLTNPFNVITSGVFFLVIISAMFFCKVPPAILGWFYGLSSIFLIPLGVYIYIYSGPEIALTRIFSLYSVLGISLYFLSQTSALEIILGLRSFEKKFFKNHPRYLSLTAMLLMWNLLGLFDHYETYKKAHIARGVKASSHKIFPEVLSARIAHTTIQTNGLIARGLTENGHSIPTQTPSDPAS